MIRSRLAPTPSGYLHLGNAINFILTWLLVRRAGGILGLRIDDADAARTRPEYVEDIFRQLEWLGLDWDRGPSGPGNFTAYHSQLQRLDRYRALFEELRRSGVIYYCTCSRSLVNRHSHGGRYPGTCRLRRVIPDAPHTIRVRAPHSLEMGDFVLWRRDDLPAYQLASLADDLAEGSNLIVRGRDLEPSSNAQLFLAAQLGGRGKVFCRAQFIHHPLLCAESGCKLAKSDQSLSLAAMRQAGIKPVDIYREAAKLLGATPGKVESLTDLLNDYDLTDRLGVTAGTSPPGQRWQNSCRHK